MIPAPRTGGHPLSPANIPPLGTEPLISARFRKQLQNARSFRVIPAWLCPPGVIQKITIAHEVLMVPPNLDQQTTHEQPPNLGQRTKELNKLCKDLGTATNEGSIGDIVTENQQLILRYYDDVLMQAKNGFTLALCVQPPLAA
jgi:hypothetical protein